MVTQVVDKYKRFTSPLYVEDGIVKVEGLDNQGFELIKLSFMIERNNMKIEKINKELEALEIYKTNLLALQ